MNFNLNNHEKLFLQDIFWATPSNKNMSGQELEERAGEKLGGERWELKRVSQGVCNMK
jgi:hypothetical protein